MSRHAEIASRGVTVAIAVKVYDGIVLGTDSATTMPLPNGDYQVWNNANKIFHLHRALPVAAMTWGLGNIGPASIATLSKDLRLRFMGADSARVDWALDRDAFTIKQVAERLREFMGDLYQAEFAGQAKAPLLGFLIAGVSSGERLAESWLVQFDDGTKQPKVESRKIPDAVGWDAFGQPEAVARLVGGKSMQLPAALKAGGLTAAQVTAVMNVLNTGVLDAPIVQPAMPFADAIGVARFLVETTCGYTRFQPGADTVGGPVELAGISRHEGFKWISRKHYYPRDLNPEDPHAPF
jgi:hypothetical protein